MPTLTTKQIAAELGIRPRSVWAAISRGVLKAEKRGRDWHAEAEEVERYRVERTQNKGGRPRKSPSGSERPTERPSVATPVIPRPDATSESGVQ